MLQSVAFLALSSLAPAQKPTGPLDFTVSGTSDCLRFLNSTVSTVYVPFTVAANENLQLTVNCTKMPGGANGYTDVYVYKGYWNGGNNYTCTSRGSVPNFRRHPTHRPPNTPRHALHRNLRRLNTAKLHSVLCGSTRRPTSNIPCNTETHVKLALFLFF